MQKIFPHVPIQLPEKEIFLRLGRNEHFALLPLRQQSEFLIWMREGFSLCQCAGAVADFLIVKQDEQQCVLEDGTVFAGEKISRFLQGAQRVLLMGGTVGKKITEAAFAAASGGNGAKALVLDALGSECADAVMDYLQNYCRSQLLRSGCFVSVRRFSPGYGDWHLQAQGDFIRLLQMEQLGVEETKDHILLPEKSVTAAAGIFRNEGESLS